MKNDEVFWTTLFHDVCKNDTTWSVSCPVEDKKTLIMTTDGMKVYVVDGDWVKLRHNMDFVEGGNDAVYGYVPQGEVWIDGHVDDCDRPYIALHELIERHMMKEHGLNYQKAHQVANKIEKDFRKDKLLPQAGVL